MKILLVEDDRSLIAVLTKSLAAHRYVVDVVQDGETGWTYGSTFEYDLIVLDVVLPKLDGISLCQRFRAEGFTTPILLLTAQNSSTSKVQGLDAGADDYVVKPFDRDELVARIRALLRRSSNNPFPLLAWGDLLLNPSTCEVTYNGQPLTLTSKEYDLLELLLRDSQHVFSSDEILDRLWSSEEFPSEATVRSHLRRVRHKLVEAGAPPDFISTVRGRGYYLKALQQPDRSTFSIAAPRGASVSKLDAASDLAIHSSEAQQQYLAFLNDTWTTAKPDCLNQVSLLLQIARDWQQQPITDSLSAQSRSQAQHAAHKLVGTLGIFGLTQAMRQAQQLEQWLGNSDRPHPDQRSLMNTWVTALQQEIHTTTTIHPTTADRESPLLLIVTPEADFAEMLLPTAVSRGLRTAIASASLAAKTWLTSESLPDVALFHVPTGSPVGKATASQTADLLALLQDFARTFPTLPILVVSERSELPDRLEVARRGGKLFLESTIDPDQIMTAVMQLIRRESQAKVMVVDDDRNWLRTLPTLLKPWGFKVTTLAEPQQFWTVLQAVTPDVLILDVNMPQINGFELCQILRNDLRWRRLPVLFLSVFTDSSSQNQAFTVGADDYLCKPVIGSELAHRILSRLQRVQTWAS